MIEGSDLDGQAGRGSTTDPTPMSWRIAALGILAGGVGLGLVSGHRRLGGVVPLITAGVAVGCVVPVALASRRPPIAPEDAADALVEASHRPTFSIVVGARDEATVLRRLVGDIGRQEYRAADDSPLFELIKIAFDAFGVAHAPKVSQRSESVTILCECQ